MPGSANFNRLNARRLTINGQDILATSTLLATGEVVDLNGEADALILDAAQNVRLDGSSAGHLKVKISGAYDFDITANTLTALSGSTIATNTIAETTATSGVTVDGMLIKDAGLVVGTSGYVDLNGETGGLIIDADANTKIYGSADDVITINVAGASDFSIAANLLTALSGSTIATNTIAETTAASGVTIDGLLIKDAGLVAGTSGYVDLNGEAGGLVFDTDGNTKLYASADDVLTLNVGGAADFTIGANLLTALSGSSIATNTIAETTAASGVTIDGALLKDGRSNLGRQVQALTASGAITVLSGLVTLAHATVVIAATLAAPVAGDELFIVNSSASGTVAHTVTLPAGVTWNGTNNTATLDAANEALHVIALSATRWYIVQNNGSVGLSTV